MPRPGLCVLQHSAYYNGWWGGAVTIRGSRRGGDPRTEVRARGLRPRSRLKTTGDGWGTPGKREWEVGGIPAGKAEIPDKDKHKGPEDFRRRVVKGLGSSSDPRLRDAVKRYAEGLVK